ncbi:hypothetical protein ABS71_17195 [bacterium SCN 62-11]|nr:hypothetical protein [Candidatus Eremiobacteraeota bacterium]ODT60668.1 MAG: hypothetical protein ABS71_17195 [bacterium SCN 62-11]
MRRNRDARGLSLAELLVYQALLLLIVGMAALFLVPSLKLQNRGLDRAEELRAAHLVMDELCLDLRQTPQACLSLQNGYLSGRRMSGWTPDGTVLLDDQGWIFEVASCRRGRCSWQQVLNLSPTWREALEPAQLQTCLPRLSWQKLSGAARLTFRDSGGQADKPRGPYSLVLQVGDLTLQQMVRPRLLR